MNDEITNAIGLLQQGNARFAEGRMQYPHLDEQTRLKTLREGQRPLAAVLACSDSRVPVVRIFDQGIGDLFLVANAGNLVTDATVGSLELGVVNFDIPLLVVLGHTNCGAVRMAMTDDLMDGKIPYVITRIRPAVKAAMLDIPQLAGEALYFEVTRTNILLAAKSLVEASVHFRDRIADGRLKVVPALYYLETGRVEWLDDD